MTWHVLLLQQLRGQKEARRIAGAKSVTLQTAKADTMVRTSAGRSPKKLFILVECVCTV